MQNHKLTGQCLCGTIQFAVDGPDKGCAHCHCESCRRAHGAPMVTWVVMADAGFEIVTEMVNGVEVLASISRSLIVSYYTRGLLFSSGISSHSWPNAALLAIVDPDGSVGMFQEGLTPFEICPSPG